MKAKMRKPNDAAHVIKIEHLKKDNFNNLNAFFKKFMKVFEVNLLQFLRQAMQFQISNSNLQLVYFNIRKMLRIPTNIYTLFN